MGCIPWTMPGGLLRKLWLEYVGCSVCGEPINPGMLCMGVALEIGELSQGSSGIGLATGPMFGGIGGRLKDSIGESCSFMVPVSIFS